MPDTTLLTNNETLARTVYTEFANGNIDAVLATMSPNIVWKEPETFFITGTHNGPTEVSTNVFGRVPELFEEFSVQPEQYVCQGDTVCVLGRFVGSVKGSGAPFNLRFCHVSTIKGGLITSFENICDTGPIQGML